MRACPRCKTQLPDNATLCVACGMRLGAAAPAAPAAPPARPAEPEAAAAKTAFGIASPIRPAPQAARPAAYPAPGAPRPAAPAAQPAPQAPAAQAPAAEPPAPKTMFGVGMAVQPVTRGQVQPPAPRQPAPQAPPAPEPPAPEGVLPSTMFGVGVAAPVAPVTSQARPAPQIAPAQAAPQAPVAPPAEPAPAGRSTGLESTMFANSASADEEVANARRQAAAVNRAKTAAAADPNLSRPTAQERELLGDSGDLPEVPGELVETLKPMPDAVAGFPAVMSYFFRVLNGKADRLVEIRRLTQENLQWDERSRYLRAALGLRALEAGFAGGPAGQLKPKIDTSGAKIRELIQKQLSESGAKGQQIKQLEADEERLAAQFTQQTTSHKQLASQFEDLDAERKLLNKEIDAAQKQGQAPPQAAFEQLQRTQGTYDELKRNTEQAKKAMEATQAHIDKNRRDRKKIAQELESLLKATAAALQAERKGLIEALVQVGDAALSAQHPLSVPFSERLADIEAGKKARQSRSASLQEQANQIDKKAFQQGGIGVGGAFLALILVLVILRFL